MANIEKISVSLTPELAAIIHEAVATGDYASTSEVVREALREWRKKRMKRQETIEEIRRLWREGIESGPGIFNSAEELIAEAERQFYAERKQLSGGEDEVSRSPES